MPDKREKTLSYRRAAWLEEGHGLTLERCLKDAHKNLTTVEERTIIRQGTHTKCLNFKETSAGGVFLHLTADTPGEFASVVPKAKPGDADLDLEIARPPPDGEWLDGDAFLYVRQNHLCLCATSMRDAAISSFIYELFKKAALRKDAIRFQLLKVADINKVRMLHKQGVKEVILKATVFQATSSFEKRKAHAFSIVGAAAKQFKSLVTKPNDYTRDGLQVWLSIRSDHRFAKDFKLGEKQIEHVAEDMINSAEEPDDFTIVTQTGQKIGPQEIFMREKVMIDGDGKTVDRDKAWRELSAFYKRLHDTGLLEQ